MSGQNKEHARINSVLQFYCNREDTNELLWGNPCNARALRATFRLDSPVKNPHTGPFQTPSKLGHPSDPNAPKFKSLKLP